MPNLKSIPFPVLHLYVAFARRYGWPRSGDAGWRGLDGFNQQVQRAESEQKEVC